MASSDLKITVTADTKGAESSLKGLDGQVDATGGGMGKLGAAGVAAGAALVAFATKGVLAYEDLGLTVGKFSDATGVSEESASRLIEVGGDIGISAETLQGSIGKMEKTLGKNAEAFDKYGVSVVKAKDGTVDANETFLNAVDAVNAIEDPMKKGEAATAIFGKGWQSMSELIGKGSDKLRSDLAAVDPSKVFGGDDVAKARELRDSFDSIKDAVETLLLTIGKALAPVISSLAKHLAAAVEAAGPLVEIIGDALVSALEVVGPIIEGVAGAIKGLTSVVSAVTDTLGVTTDKSSEFMEGMLALVGPAHDAGMSVSEFNAVVRDAGGDLDKLKDSLAESGVEIKLTTKETLAIAYAHRELKDAAREAGMSEDEFSALLRSTRGDLDKTQTAITEFGAATDAAREATDKSGESLKKHKQAGDDATSVWTDLADAVGGTTPKVHDATEAQDALSTALGRATGAVGDAKDGYQATKTAAQELATALGELNTGAVGDVKLGFEQAKTPVDAFNASINATAAATTTAGEAYDLLMGRLNAKEAWTNAQEAVDLLHWKMADGSSAAEVDKQLLATEKSLATYISTLDGVPDKKKTELYAELDQGNVDAVARYLDELAHARSVSMKVYVTPGGVKYTASSGTESSPGGSTLVGEFGPEIVDLPGGTHVRNSTQTAMDRSQTGGGGLTVQVVVQGSLIHQNDLMQHIYDGLVDLTSRGVVPPGRI